MEGKKRPEVDLNSKANDIMLWVFTLVLPKDANAKFKAAIMRNM